MLGGERSKSIGPLKDRSKRLVGNVFQLLQYWNDLTVSEQNEYQRRARLEESQPYA